MLVTTEHDVIVNAMDDYVFSNIGYWSSLLPSLSQLFHDSETPFQQDKCTNIKYIKWLQNLSFQQPYTFLYYYIHFESRKLSFTQS